MIEDCSMLDCGKGNLEVRAWWQPWRMPSAGVGVEINRPTPQRYMGQSSTRR